MGSKMIRSSKEAREYCEMVKRDHRCFSEFHSLNYEFCRGYLAALEGVEVRALMEWIMETSCSKECTGGCVCGRLDVLDQYHEAVKDL